MARSAEKPVNVKELSGGGNWGMMRQLPRHPGSPGAAIRAWNGHPGYSFTMTSGHGARARRECLEEILLSVPGRPASFEPPQFERFANRSVRCMSGLPLPAAS